MAEKDRVGRARAPADVFSKKSQVMSEHPLSFFKFLGTESVSTLSAKLSNSWKIRFYFWHILV